VIDPLLRALATVLHGQAGVRLRNVPGLREHLHAGGAVGRIAADVLGHECFPVRALLFDKSAETNWALGWHQDRTIAVAERREVPGYGPWTVKRGTPHVEPPITVLERMVTLRVHLDPVPATNAPLLIVPGSHRLGRIPEAEIGGIVAEHGSMACLADAGDVRIYSTPILHASDVATVPARRRVLQIDYAADALSGELVWAGT
jgi:ectoine hydroxylase-related dioxygenase (phytanoyl-CoA dioxygenase family)